MVETKKSPKATANSKTLKNWFRKTSTRSNNRSHATDTKETDKRLSPLDSTSLPFSRDILAVSHQNMLIVITFMPRDPRVQLELQKQTTFTPQQHASRIYPAHSATSSKSFPNLFQNFPLQQIRDPLKNIVNVGSSLFSVFLSSV